MMRLKLLLFGIVVFAGMGSLRAQWVQVNGSFQSDGPQGGSINCIAQCGPYVLAGTGNGIFLTSDTGNSWVLSDRGNALFQGIAYLGRGCMVALANSLGNFEESNISRDSGKTWDFLANLPWVPTHFYSLVQTNGYLLAFSTEGEERSLDSGRTWSSPVNPQSNLANVTAVAADSGFFYAIKDSGYYEGEYPGCILYRSKADDTAWTRIGLLPLVDTAAYTVYGLFVTGQTIIATTDYAGCFRSTDGGVTWEHFGGPGQDQVHHSLEASNGMLFLGTAQGLYRSTDTGSSWQATWLMGSAIQGLSAGSDGILFASTPEGIFNSVDTGHTWNESNCGIVNASTGVFAENGKLLASSASSQTGQAELLHFVNDRDWQPVDIGLGLDAGVVIIDDSGIIGTSSMGLLRSSDDGHTWSKWGSMPTNFRLAESSILAENQGMLFAATNDAGIFRSIDEGRNWVEVNNKIKVHFIRAFGNQGNAIFLSTDSGIFRSTDSGINWIYIAQAKPFQFVSDANNLYASMLYSGMNSNGIHLYRSTDLGVTWTDIWTNSDWSLNEVSSMDVIGSVILVGATAHQSLASDVLMLSTDFGQHWALHDFFSPSSFAVKGEYLYIGTSKLGVERELLSEILGSSAVTEKPQVASKIFIYPNPLSQSTTISFTPQSTGYADISIVNQLGVEIARIFSGELAAGEHSFQWSTPTGMPNGMYECVVRMNERVETLPMLLRSGIPAW